MSECEYWAVRWTSSDGTTGLCRLANATDTSKYSSLVAAANGCEVFRRKGTLVDGYRYRIVHITKRKKPSVEERIAEAVKAERIRLRETALRCREDAPIVLAELNHRIANNTPPGEP
jgi:hypothetical protein